MNKVTKNSRQDRFFLLIVLRIKVLKNPQRHSPHPFLFFEWYYDPSQIMHLIDAMEVHVYMVMTHHSKYLLSLHQA